MKVFCDDAEIFEDLTQRRELQRLLLRVSAGQHKLILKDIDRFRGSAFFQSLAATDKREWEEVFEQAAFGSDMENRTEEPGARPAGVHASVSRVRQARTTTCRFPLIPNEIGIWAEQPLTVLMENKRDVALLKAAARVYGYPEVEDACGKRWLVVDGRGGCGEVLNSVRDRKRTERLFAFCDKDPDRNGVRSKASKLIEEECQKDPVIPFFCTHKHEIENYVPEAVLKSRIVYPLMPPNPAPSTRHAAFLAWQALTDEEKDVDDLKKRFGEPFMREAMADLADPAKCQDADFRARARTAGVDDLDLALRDIATHL